MARRYERSAQTLRVVVPAGVPDVLAGGGSPMGMGPITWACLLLTAHQSPAPQETFLNQRGVQIGINVHPQRRANLKELALLVSHDQGKVWTIGAQVPPSAKA